MIPPALPSALTPPSRSWLITALGWLAIALGGVTFPVSFISVLMLSTQRYENGSDTIGFMVVVFGPAALLVAGIGLLRRRRWGHLLALGLTVAFALSCVVDLVRHPLGPTTKVTQSPSGVTTTTFDSGSSRSIVPLGLSVGFIAFLLLPPIRRELAG